MEIVSIHLRDDQMGFSELENGKIKINFRKMRIKKEGKCLRLRKGSRLSK